VCVEHETLRTGSDGGMFIDDLIELVSMATIHFLNSEHRVF
jgi:hypothetical protein